MAVKSSSVFFFSSTPKITPYSPRCSKLKPPRGIITGFSCSGLRYDDDDDDDKRKAPIKRSHGESFCCICRRRRFIEGATATSTALAVFPNGPSNASDLHSDDYRSVLNKVRPPRPDWCEEFYASVLDKFMDSYEAEIADYKSQLFSNLKGRAQRVLEIGIGTGPNLKVLVEDGLY
nr:hypothetical protein CFP56_45083 [Quercus suber]